jgi:hypothetical protein
VGGVGGRREGARARPSLAHPYAFITTTAAISAITATTTTTTTTTTTSPPPSPPPPTHTGTSTIGGDKDRARMGGRKRGWGEIDAQRGNDARRRVGERLRARGREVVENGRAMRGSACVEKGRTRGAGRREGEEATNKTERRVGNTVCVGGICRGWASAKWCRESGGRRLGKRERTNTSGQPGDIEKGKPEHTGRRCSCVATNQVVAPHACAR